MGRALAPYALLFLLAACATPYQLGGLTGGQQPTWVKDGVLEVSSVGNGYASDARVRELALLRAAETAIEANYRYFVEIDAEDTGATDTIHTMSWRMSEEGYAVPDFASPGMTTDVYRPGLRATYRMFEEQPSGAKVYDAFAIYNALGARYIDDFEPKEPPAG